MDSNFSNIYFFQIIQSALKTPKASPPNMDMISCSPGNQSPAHNNNIALNQATGNSASNTNNNNSRNDSGKKTFLFQVFSSFTKIFNK